uniref:radical SAM family heme chaperone HemW n=1 Tax=Coprococcus catus TaxID=116085 RepID=UPI00031DEF39|nr:radical SAM family heme chaperone HemW [Coprococcus catus]
MTDKNKRPLGLYLHFPFCVRKCRYCDFLSFPSGEAGREIYLERLKEEIKARGAIYQDYNIETLFIGGGTPSLMTGQQLTELLDTVRASFHVSPVGEWTMECNPGTTDAETLRIYRNAGINRLSFGLQSMNDEELKYLGRIHTAKQFAENYQAARRVGFENINIDLMSALPGQTTASWLDTLNKAAAFEPEHLSAYSLIIEEETPFWDLYGDDRSGEANADGIIADGGAGQQGKAAILTLPDEDSERQMYHLTKRILAEKGYERYEISNYTRKGFECRHNLIYWQRKDYLGLGLGAASMVGNRRFSNVSDMTSYMHDWSYCQEEILDRKAQIEETMFLGLRCTAGVSDRMFTEKFGQSMMDIYGDIIRKYLSEGFLIYNPSDGRLAFSEAGTDVSNWILSDFLL